MATYIALASFTEQGIRSVKDTVKRADLVKESAGKFGVRMNSIHWITGQYDLVTFCEADSDAAIAAFGLAIAQQGNVKMQTCRAFDRDEMAAILAKLP